MYISSSSFSVAIFPPLFIFISIWIESDSLDSSYSSQVNIVDCFALALLKVVKMLYIEMTGCCLIIDIILCIKLYVTTTYLFRSLRKSLIVFTFFRRESYSSPCSKTKASKESSASMIKIGPENLIWEKSGLISKRVSSLVYWESTFSSTFFSNLLR